jgi:hypothetical protein
MSIIYIIIVTNHDILKHLFFFIFGNNCFLFQNTCTEKDNGIHHLYVRDHINRKYDHPFSHPKNDLSLLAIYDLNTCNYNKLFLNHMAVVQDNFQTDEGI